MRHFPRELSFLRHMGLIRLMAGRFCQFNFKSCRLWPKISKNGQKSRGGCRVFSASILSYKKSLYFGECLTKWSKKGVAGPGRSPENSHETNRLMRF